MLAELGQVQLPAWTGACLKVVCHILEVQLKLSSLSVTESVRACFPTGNVAWPTHAM